MVKTGRIGKWMKGGLAGILLATAPFLSSCKTSNLQPTRSYSQNSQKIKYPLVPVTGREKQRVRDRLEVQDFLASENFEAKKVEFTPGRASYLIRFPEFDGEDLMEKGFPKAVTYSECTLYFQQIIEKDAEWLYGVLHHPKNTQFDLEAEKQYVILAKKEFENHSNRNNKEAFIENQISIEDEASWFSGIKKHERRHEEIPGEGLEEEIEVSLRDLAEGSRIYHEFALDALNAVRGRDSESQITCKTILDEYAKHGITPYSNPTREQIRKTAKTILEEREQAMERNDKN